jgi:hypothetical protein
MTKTRLKDTLASSAGISTSPLPATTAPAVPAPSDTPAAPKPRSAATAVIEKDIEETLVSYQGALEALEALETELDDLKDRYPRQFQEVADRLGIDIEEKKPKIDFSNLQIGTSAILVVLISIMALVLFWSWWNKTPNALSGAQPMAMVEASQTGFESVPTPTVSEVGMIVVPTSTAEVVATATIEATAEATAVPTAVPPTAVPPTAIPPTAIPPTAVPPTAVPVLVFWNSADKGVDGVDVFPVGADGAVCSGDKVAGEEGPVTIPFPPNYGNVEVVWGRCTVNGGTAQKIADEDTSAWKKQFVVKEAP